MRIRGQQYTGQHSAIIDRETWDQVQACLLESGVRPRSGKNTKGRQTFAGRIFDETGDSLRAHHANKKGRRYHYYVSGRLLASPGTPDLSGWRLPARELDRTIARIVVEWLQDHRELEAVLLSAEARIDERATLTSAAHHIADRWQQENGNPASIANLVGRIALAPAEIRITLDRHNLCDALGLTSSSSAATEDIIIVTPAALRRRGVEAKLVTGGDGTRIVAPDAKLIGAIASARSWFTDLQTGNARSVLELAARHSVHRSNISRTLPLAFLAPDIVTAVIDGRADLGLTLSRVKRLKLPASWQAQRKLLGINTN